ncbi:MAG: DUF1049 domain-containing protein [Methylococcaceae bacterium]|nr:DUF1049 domain-containing protein [Methylococcaceae bacterium]
MKIVLFIVFSVVFIIALIFSLLNFHLVEINLGFTSLNLPLAVALTIELFAGVVIGLLVAFLKILKLKSDYAQLDKQLNRSLKK